MAGAPPRPEPWGQQLVPRQPHRYTEHQWARRRGRASSPPPFFAALASGLFSVIGGILEFSGARELAAIVLGALVMAASLTVHNAALWGRIVTGVLLLVSLCANGLEFTDVASGATTALGVTANLLGIAAIVMSFLPATNRYAAARKARTAQPLRT